jgi:hypothetical protein
VRSLAKRAVTALREQMRRRSTGMAFSVFGVKVTMHGRAWLGQGIRQSVRQFCRWLRDLQGRRAFYINMHVPEHVRRDMGRFAAFDVAGTHVHLDSGPASGRLPNDLADGLASVRLPNDLADGLPDASADQDDCAQTTQLTVECDHEADRIVHLRRLWTTFPALRDCAFHMSGVVRAAKWPALL